MPDKVGRINQLTEIDEVYRAENENEKANETKYDLEFKHLRERITNIEMLLQEHGIIRKD